MTDEEIKTFWTGTCLVCKQDFPQFCPNCSVSSGADVELSRVFGKSFQELKKLALIPVNADDRKSFEFYCHECYKTTFGPRV